MEPYIVKCYQRVYVKEHANILSAFVQLTCWLLNPILLKSVLLFPAWLSNSHSHASPETNKAIQVDLTHEDLPKKRGKAAREHAQIPLNNETGFAPSSFIKEQARTTCFDDNKAGFVNKRVSHKSLAQLFSKHISPKGVMELQPHTAHTSCCGEIA